MAFQNTSVFFIPVIFEDYGKFIGHYDASGLWQRLLPEETETQYLLDYAHRLSMDRDRYTCLRYSEPSKAPIYLYEDLFGSEQRVGEIRLSCFATGVGFLEIWVTYGDMPTEQIIDFSYRFKKTKVHRDIPEDKKQLYDFASELLPSAGASLYFPCTAEFKYECTVFHCLRERENCPQEQLHRRLQLLKRSYNTSFSDQQDSADYDMTYAPYSYDLWAGSQEGLVNLVTTPPNDQSNYFVEHFKYRQLMQDYRFLYLLLLNQQYSAIRYISEISTADYDRMDHSELQKKLMLLKTSFSFRVISVDLIYQNIYSRMYNIFRIDELLADLSENQELVSFQHSQKLNEAEKKSNRLLYAISILSVFSALIDAAGYFDRLPFPWLPGSATVLSALCVLIGIGIFLILTKTKK